MREWDMPSKVSQFFKTVKVRATTTVWYMRRVREIRKVPGFTHKKEEASRKHDEGKHYTCLVLLNAENPQMIDEFYIPDSEMVHLKKRWQ